MKFDPQDLAIVELLEQLKNFDDEYPQKLLATRRQMYLKQVANIELGDGIDSSRLSNFFETRNDWNK